MNSSNIDCQEQCLIPGSLKTSWIASVRARFLRHLRELGPLGTTRRACQKIFRKLQCVSPNSSLVGKPVLQSRLANLNLRAGEWVEVKSEEEIRATFNNNGTTAGLQFMPGMKAYCGQEFRVYRRVANIIMDGTGEVRKLKNTVLLEGAICNGGGMCDRSCFYFWRESWLRRRPDA